MGDQFAAQICLRDAWPAIETEELCGWLLRAGKGGYNRANSVWPGRFTGEVSLGDAIDRVETFYRRRNLSPRFQVLDIAQPTELDDVLARRGYHRDLACSDMWKPAAPVAISSDVTVTPEAGAEWLSLYGSEQPPEKMAEYPRILRRLPAARGFIVCRRDGRAAGVALVGKVGHDAVLDCVLTRPEARRSGAAQAVVTAAEAWAAGEGARRLLLSVVDSNARALPLYLKLGFRKLAAYHYRFKPA